jgi:hypothetical protein
MLMDQPSEGPNPAKLWRYLALEEEERVVTFIGIRDLFFAEEYLKRAALLPGSDLKIWRTPIDRSPHYRPVDPDRFASMRSYPVLELLSAYLWHLRFRDGFSKPISAPTTGESHASWQSADLDEFFLLTVFYPRAAFDGMLSLIEANDCHSRWLILDTEYATWANPTSETLFIRSLPCFSSKEGFCEEYLANSVVEMFFHPNLHPDLTIKVTPDLTGQDR